MKNILSIIIIIISIAVFVLVVRPQYDIIKSMQTENSELGGVLVNARTLQSSRDNLLDKRSKFKAEDLLKLKKLIPESADNVKLILEFEEMADRYDLEIQAASTVKDESKNINGSSDQGNTQAFDVETKDYGIVTLDLTLVGGYSEFIDFLVELERNIRITDLRTLNIAPPTGGEGQYQYQISVETYWLKDNIL
jgi:Tfp pilus assembly protein PilO